MGEAQLIDPESIPFERRLHADIAERGLKDVVHFVGRRADIPDLLAASDIFAMVSQEGFSLVYLEAMAASLPVVAERSGGAPEVVIEGETAFLIEPGDIPGLAQALIQLLGDAKLRARMGAAGRRHVEAQFAPPRVSQIASDALRHFAG